LGEGKRRRKSLTREMRATMLGIEEVQVQEGDLWVLELKLGVGCAWDEVGL
jgi:hypothetical protein